MSRTGFATPVALGFALLMGLLAASALHDASLARSLSTARLLHQRAFAAGEYGLAQTLIDLTPSDAPVPAPRRVTLPGHPTDSVETVVSEVLATELPPGYSAGRIVERHFEVRSTGGTRAQRKSRTGRGTAPTGAGGSAMTAAMCCLAAGPRRCDSSRHSHIHEWREMPRRSRVLPSC